MLYEEFDPSKIPFQQQVIYDLNQSYDYDFGTHEILLSGAIGSAKTTLMAFLVMDHCFKYVRAKALLGRLSMPELKETIFQEICEMIPEHFEEGRDYKINETKASIDFCNGSRIISRSWSDKRYRKVRSLNLTCAAIEELTENEDLEFYQEIKYRVGRSATIPEKFIVSATNPDGPSHPAYEYFINSKSPQVHVYYSKTEDNPFLPKSYVDQLLRDLDPKMARRMLFGEWVDVFQESIYYSYHKENDIADIYKVDDSLPKIMTFDFNIGVGKPMSMLVMQEDKKGAFHCFDEIVVEGFRTLNMLEEAVNKPWFHGHFILCGDATGRARSTNSNRSDWEIIEKFMSDHPNVTYEVQVPRANPPIRARHNIVNAYLLNALNEVRLFIYDPCKTLREGLLKTAFKKGSSNVEDDSKYYQHITTALGYAVYFRNLLSKRKPSHVREF